MYLNLLYWLNRDYYNHKFKKDSIDVVEGIFNKASEVEYTSLDIFPLSNTLDTLYMNPYAKNSQTIFDVPLDVQAGDDERLSINDGGICYIHNSRYKRLLFESYDSMWKEGYKTKEFPTKLLTYFTGIMNNDETGYGPYSEGIFLSVNNEVEGLDFSSMIDHKVIDYDFSNLEITEDDVEKYSDQVVKMFIKFLNLDKLDDEDIENVLDEIKLDPRRNRHVNTEKFYGINGYYEGLVKQLRVNYGGPKRKKFAHKIADEEFNNVIRLLVSLRLTFVMSNLDYVLSDVYLTHPMAVKVLTSVFHKLCNLKVLNDYERFMVRSIVSTTLLEVMELNTVVHDECICGDKRFFRYMNENIYDKVGFNSYKVLANYFMDHYYNDIIADVKENFAYHTGLSRSSKITEAYFYFKNLSELRKTPNKSSYDAYSLSLSDTIEYMDVGLLSRNVYKVANKPDNSTFLDDIIDYTIKSSYYKINHLFDYLDDINDVYKLSDSGKEFLLLLFYSANNAFRFSSYVLCLGNLYIYKYDILTEDDKKILHNIKGMMEYLIRLRYKYMKFVKNPNYELYNPFSYCVEKDHYDKLVRHESFDQSIHKAFGKKHFNFFANLSKDTMIENVNKKRHDYCKFVFDIILDSDESLITKFINSNSKSDSQYIDSIGNVYNKRDGQRFIRFLTTDEKYDEVGIYDEIMEYAKEKNSDKCSLLKNLIFNNKIL